MTQPEPARCGVACGQHPETTCTDTAGHTGPHGGPLIVNGKEIGGAAWGPDRTEPAQPRHTADSITDDALTALYDWLATARATAKAERTRAEEAERKAEAMTAAMESTAAAALRHSGCHMKLMTQCTRAETAEAERDAARNTLARVRAVADEWATTARRYPDSRLSTATVAYVIRTALDPHQTQETT